MPDELEQEPHAGTSHGPTLVRAVFFGDDTDVSGVGDDTDVSHACRRAEPGHERVAQSLPLSPAHEPSHLRRLHMPATQVSAKL